MDFTYISAPWFCDLRVLVPDRERGEERQGWGCCQYVCTPRRLNHIAPELNYEFDGCKPDTRKFKGAGGLFNFKNRKYFSHWFLYKKKFDRRRPAAKWKNGIFLLITNILQYSPLKIVLKIVQEKSRNIQDQ